MKNGIFSAVLEPFYPLHEAKISKNATYFANQSLRFFYFCSFWNTLSYMGTWEGRQSQSDESLHPHLLCRFPAQGVQYVDAQLSQPAVDQLLHNDLRPLLPLALLHYLHHFCRQTFCPPVHFIMSAPAQEKPSLTTPSWISLSSSG